jgi:CBS domain-containing protein
MDDVYAGNVMTSDVVTVTPDTLVEDAANTMLAEGIGSLIVVSASDTIEGILTTTDFVEIVANSRPKAETTVSRYMSSIVVSATAQTPVREIADRMLAQEVHHIPITDDDGEVIGIVTTSDLTEYLSATQVGEIPPSSS